MLGDVEVDDAPAVMGEHDEDEEDTQAGGGCREEIDRDQVSDMVSEERPPGLRGFGAPLRDEPGDAALGHVDAELEELAVDSGGTPQGIRRGHFSDQGGDLGVDGGAPAGRPAGERGPVLAEAAPLPPQNGSRGYDHEGLPPPGPDPGQPDPEDAIRRAQLGPRLRPPVHGELVAQGEVLEGQLAMAAAEQREKSKQVEEEGDHRAEIVSGSAPTDQRLAAGGGFGEGQVRGGHAGDQSLDLGMDGWATSGRAARELAPVLAEAAPLPPQDGVGGNDHEGLPPPGPDSSQPDPEKKRRSLRRSLGRRAILLYTASCWRKARFSRASWRWPPQRNGRSRSRWRRRGIIGLGVSLDQSQQINHLLTGRSFGEGHAESRSRSRAD